MSKKTPETKAVGTSKVDAKPTKDTTVKSAVKPERRKTKSWIAISIILLAIVGASVYVAWLMQPANALAGGLSNLIQTRNESFSFEAKSLVDDEMTTIATGNVAYNKNQAHLVAEAEGGVVVGNLEAKYLGEDGAYVKVNGTAETMINIQTQTFQGFMSQGEQEPGMEALMAELEASMQAAIEPVGDAVDDKWIAVNPKNVKEALDENISEDYKCMQEAVNLLDKRSTRNEIRSIYKEHPFVKIEEELGTKDGAVGFIVTPDEDAAKEFGKALEETELYKKISKCNESEDDAENITPDALSTLPDPLEGITPGNDTKIELWISQFTHKIQTVKVSTIDPSDTVVSELLIDFTTNFDGDFSKPEGTTPLQTVLKELTSVLGQDIDEGSEEAVTEEELAPAQ